MLEGFYRAFEDRYRGSHAVIKARLEAYLPFLLPILKLYPAAPTLDIGCGRGEWLELLTEQGFDASGVDLDEGMLQGCIERGLNAKREDGFTRLASLSDESMAIISAFHVVEHISFEQLQKLMAEAFRVLKPGGLLILETPNPENFVVSTRTFHLDPTHNKPIPSELLSFVAEYAGFSRVKVLRLQEEEPLVDKVDIRLYHVITGVSPDYSIVAQKPAPEALLLPFHDVFAKNYGLNFYEILHKFDQRIARVEQLEATLIATYSSTSWRVTAPLRWVMAQFQRLKHKGQSSQ